MSQYLPKLEADQLQQLSEEVNRIAGSLAKLSLGAGNKSTAIGVHDDCNRHEVTEETVRWLINARNRRSQFLPSTLFADPAWDILLELFRAELAGQRISVSSACFAANVPPTTGLRYIKALVEQNMILREPDRFDARRVYVALMPEISSALCNYFVNVVQQPLTSKGARVQSVCSSPAV